MKASPEIFKGIEYVRLASLPLEQKEQIRASMDREVIIKIIRDGVLINDCVPYSDYLKWYSQVKAQEARAF